MSANTHYLAMWSGPRNISTAMMRSWGSRADTAVIDEPFYGYYLRQTGIAHPGYDDIIASQPATWQQVVEDITGQIPAGKSLYYQKHITTHMLPEIGLDWLTDMSHCFLVRAPERVVASYSRTRPDVNAADLGYHQQRRIFDEVCERTNVTPPVIDTDRFLLDPKGQLEAVCNRLGLAFDNTMLSWPPGIRDTDGVWHPYWYDSVAKSTGFNTGSSPLPELSDAAAEIAGQCRSHYETMLAHVV